MVTPAPTREDLFQKAAASVIIRQNGRQPGNRILPTAIFTPGTTVNVLLAGVAAIGAEVIRNVLVRTAALYLDSATDEDLDRLVTDRDPDLVRKQASRALVTLELVRTIPPSAGEAGTIPQATVFRTATGESFETLAPLGFALNSTGPIRVQARALTAGSAGNVDAGTITEPAAALFDPTITVTNPDIASGGAEVESDSSYRQRARLNNRNRTKGTLEAITLAALNVDGVLTATATEVVDSTGNPVGLVNLAISDNTGRANQTLVRAVESNLEDARAAGVPVRVFPGSRRLVNIAYQVQFDSTVADQAAVISQIKSLVLSAVNALGPNETLYTSLLTATARRIPGVIVTDGSLVTPVGDIVPLENEILKTELGRITVNGF